MSSVCSIETEISYTGRILLSSTTVRDPFTRYSTRRTVNYLSESETKRYGTIPTGTLLTGSSNARGYEKIAMFGQYLAVSGKRYKIEPWNGNKKPYLIF